MTFAQGLAWLELEDELAAEWRPLMPFVNWEEAIFQALLRKRAQVAESTRRWRARNVKARRRAERENRARRLAAGPDRIRAQELGKRDRWLERLKEDPERYEAQKAKWRAATAARRAAKRPPPAPFKEAPPPAKREQPAPPPGLVYCGCGCGKLIKAQDRHGRRQRRHGADFPRLL